MAVAVDQRRLPFLVEVLTLRGADREWLLSRIGILSAEETRLAFEQAQVRCVRRTLEAELGRQMVEEHERKQGLR